MQQEQIIPYIYNSEISVFPAEIELLEWCVTAFYQQSNKREETENTVLKRNLKVGEEVLRKM